MAEFGGKVYLSAYAVPVQHDEGGRHEIARILDYIFEHGWEITEEELTPLVRENYTALLLLCDPEGGTPRTFYSVQGSLGGKLSVKDGSCLEWDVESVVSAFFSPATRGRRRGTQDDPDPDQNRFRIPAAAWGKDPFYLRPPFASILLVHLPAR